MSEVRGLLFGRVDLALPEPREEIEKLVAWLDVWFRDGRRVGHCGGNLLSVEWEHVEAGERIEVGILGIEPHSWLCPGLPGSSSPSSAGVTIASYNLLLHSERRALELRCLLWSEL